MAGTKTVNTGLNALRDLWLTEGTHVGAGTGTTNPVAGDTALETEVSEKAVSGTLSGATGVAVHKMRLLVSEGNGNDYSEVGLKDGASGTLLNRATFAPTTKDNTKELEFRLKTTLTDGS